MSHDERGRVTGRFGREVFKAKMLIELEGAKDDVGDILVRLASVVGTGADFGMGADDPTETRPVDAPADPLTQPVDSPGE